MYSNEYFEHSVPSSVDGNEIPLGMGMAFSSNLSALSEFVNMSNEQQKEIIKKAKQVNSSEEMQSFINSLSHDNNTI